MSRVFAIGGKNFWKDEFGPHNYELTTRLGMLILTLSIPPI